MVYDDFDAASHGFGLVATAALYKRLTGDTRYDRFGTLIGAVVNGPNDRSLYSDGLGEFFDEGRDCHRGGYGAFTGHGSRFVDDARSWQTVEPAIDFTATAALAFALTG
jgi:hypothetical protein